MAAAVCPDCEGVIAENRRPLAVQLRGFDRVWSRRASESGAPSRLRAARGMGFHHGSLPMEVRIGIEEAVSDGVIFVPCGNHNPYGGRQPACPIRIDRSSRSTDRRRFEEFITGPRLINAIGQAGRAAKETEGIVVLARQSRPQEESISSGLQPGEDSLHMV